MAVWEKFSWRELERPGAASEVLGHTLARGTIVPLIGAGLSQSVGLPNWADLVLDVAVAYGLTADVISGDLLADMDEIRRRIGDHRLPDAVTDRLYQGGAGTEEILASPLLQAVGALVMASGRGSAAEVLTLNFDDVLETFLHLNGFMAQVVVDLPEDIDSNRDVFVYHLHGFLPSRGGLFERSASLVVTAADYRRRLGNPAETPWRTLLGSLFLKGPLLIIGSSLRDLDITSMLENVSGHLEGKRPLGFYLGYFDETIAGSDAVEAELQRIRELKLIPVNLRHKEVPGFLLGIARTAAAIRGP